MGQVCPKAFCQRKTAENGAIHAVRPTKEVKTQAQLRKIG